MSLLLDALKRAEQEKLARAPGDAGPAGVPPREPVAPRSIAPTPSGSLELQSLSSGGGAHTLGGPPRPDSGGAHTLGGTPRPDSAGAHAAQVMFQAKAAPETRSRGMLWATIAAVAVVVAAAAAYVWYSVRSLAPQAAVQPRPRAAPIAPPAGAPPMQSPAAEMALLSATQGGRPASEIPMRPALEAPAPAPVPAPLRAALPATPAQTVAQLLRESAVASATPQLRLDRSTDAPRRVPAEVASGYEALRQGNLATARRSYEAAVAADPVNVDARLGLATVEARSGNRSSAAASYRRALDLEPRNPTALAGLAALADFSRPDALEGQLRADIASAPGSAALHFTLGNLYASQARWREAQVEYFEAHRLDPGSGDILYNLAVSLDSLGQARVAAGFYQRALEAARDNGAQFDPAPAARRLAEIR